MSPRVCVYGGTSAGVIAAVEAAQQGCEVLLINPLRHLGGMTSGGLGATDMGNPEAIGGKAREFYARLGKPYGIAEQWRFEPHRAEEAFETWIREAGVKVLNEKRLAGVTKTGHRLSDLKTDDGAVFEATQFIDASYEGDLMAAAGVDWTVGRESRQAYGEDLAGVRGPEGRAGFSVPVDPYVKPGDPGSGLLPGIQPGDGGKVGEADRLVQAYNYRLCLTQDEDKILPILPPKSYDPWRYELLGRYLRALQEAKKPVKLSSVFLIVKMSGGKTDFNNNGPVSSDMVGESWDYPLADWAGREKIARAHEDYIRGMFHFLGTDLRVPDYVRRETQSWGLCRDEFTDTGGWPHQLYVREARRMVGAAVLTQADCQNRTSVPDPVAMGSYTIDCHACQRIVDQGQVVREGGLGTDVNPYPISYRTLTPRQEQCGNLLVPVCLSASHVACGSFRMEPVYMALGQAAGLAAARAAQAGKDVQDLDGGALSRELAQAGQVVRWDKARSTWHGGWAHDPFVVQSYQWWLNE